MSAYKEVEKVNEGEEVGTLATVIGLPFALALGVLAALYHGWVASKLWAWFVVPTFAAPALNVVQSSGILLIVGILRFDSDRRKTDNKASLILTRAVVGPGLYLLIGWVLHNWIAQ